MNNEPNFENPTPELPNETSATKVCPVCGKEATANASFCGECGHSFGAGATPFTVSPQAALPEDIAPLKTSDYLLMLLVTSLPFVGFILLLIWAFASDTNANRRNFSRACLIATAIVWVIAMLLSSALVGLNVSLEDMDFHSYYGAILPFIFH